MFKVFAGNKIKIIISAVFFIILAGATIYLSVTGKLTAIISAVFSNLPFFSFIYTVYENFSDFKNELPTLTWTDTTTSDMTKLIITTAFSGILFYISSKLFLQIGGPRNQILFDGTPEYEHLETAEKKLSYKVKKAVFLILSDCVGSFFAGSVIFLFSKITNSITNPQSKSIVFIILLLLVVAIYCVVYSYITKKSISFSLLKTVIFNFLPEMVSTFITTSIMLLIYFDAMANGFGWKTILGIILLFIWCWLSDFICNKISALFIGASTKQKSPFFIPNFVAFLYLYFSSFLTYYFGYYFAGNAAEFDKATTQIINNLPALPFFALLANQQDVLSYILNNTSWFFGELVKAFLFAFMISVLLKLNMNSSGLKGYCVDAALLFLSISGYSLILFLWDKISFFPIILISVFIVLTLFKKFHQAFNIIEILTLSLFIVLSAVILCKTFNPELMIGSLLLTGLSLGAFVIWRILKRVCT